SRRSTCSTARRRIPTTATPNLRLPPCSPTKRASLRNEALPVSPRGRRPTLPDRERPGHPWGGWLQRLLLSGIVVVAGVAAFPQLRPAGTTYRVGDISRERVTAPFDFHVRKD